MIMTQEAFPFLVSRNRSIDYRTIVAPQFICNAKIPSLVSRVAGGALTEAGTVILQRVKGSKAGDFTVVFRVVQAYQSDLNGYDNKELKDQFGREIYLIEGLIFQGLKQIDEINLTSQGFVNIHDHLMSQYRQFWQEIDPPSAVPSHPSKLGEEQSGQPLVIKQQPDFEIPPPPPLPPEHPKPPKLSFAALMSLVIVLILTVWFLSKLTSFLGSQVSHPRDGVVSVASSPRKYLVIAPDGNEFIITDGTTIYRTHQRQKENGNLVVLDSLSSKSIEEEISLKGQEPFDVALSQLQRRHPTAIIFLSGSLKLKSAVTSEVKIVPHQYQVLEMSGTDLKLRYYPLDQALAQFKQTQAMGKLTAKIIQPRPAFLTSKNG